MSTHIYQYVIFGAKLTKDWISKWEKFYSKDFHDSFEGYSDNNESGLVIIYDDYSGEDNYIGKIIKKTNDYEFLDSFSFWDIALDGVSEIGIRMKIRESLGLYGPEGFQLKDGIKEATYHVVTNYR